MSYFFCGKINDLLIGCFETQQFFKQAIEDANSENSHVEKRKKDFLAHNRISQILATKYPMTCLVCRGCKGTLKTV